MKILIHSTTLDGEPLQADGIALDGKNCAELVEIMKGQTPFTITTTPGLHARCARKIETERNFKLSEDPEAAAAEFLTTLAKYGLVEFLPDDAFIDLPPNETFEEEDDLCAGK